MVTRDERRGSVRFEDRDRFLEMLFATNRVSHRDICVELKLTTGAIDRSSGNIHRQFRRLRLTKGLAETAEVMGISLTNAKMLEARPLIVG